ncbi:MAG: hypothetical protein OXN90_08030 [Gemmatimonadota bacterium]|nr:hypothetical protein [Gemmatimonadota bacterium]
MSRYYPPKPKSDKRKTPSITAKQHRTAQAVARVLMRLPAKK